ncbi:glutathione S-transferase family protein [Qipengyuania nanhaisediminis]|uniref:glutathione S-transferase family protein n=1 Tax=Qipengyuania nanhaisediminis TaxID=604088 RepID=UPI0038B3F5A8
MTVTFYDCKTAPSPRRARILLALKQVPHESVEIDLRSGEQLGEAFRAINPACTVPALKLDDGHVLTDNAGIAAWLEAAYPDPPLLGTDPFEKADIASWNARIEGELGWGVASALRNSTPMMKGRALPGPDDYEQIPALAERGLRQVDNFFARLDDHLDGREFIAAGRLSVADVTCFCFTDFARVVKKQPSEEMTNIARWREGLRARSEFQL